MNKLTKIQLLISGLLFGSSLSFAQENLLSNGDFAYWEGNCPAGWSIWTQGQEIVQSEGPIPGGNSLKMTLKKSYGKKSGEIIQRIPVKADTSYRLTAKIKGTGEGLVQVKQLQDKKELSRSSSKTNKGDDWTDVSVTINSGDANMFMVLLRWNQEEASLGKTVEFADLSLTELGDLTYTGEEVPPRIVATYNNLSVYWRPTGATEKKAVSVHYRKAGTTKWKEAMPLWFDNMEHSGDMEGRTAEYRGSIVNLNAGTAYEVKLNLQDGVERIIPTQTRSDQFKVARTVTLPTISDKVYTINEGGSEETGYVLYQAAPGTVWDGKNELECQLKVEASYVIVRGLTLIGAKENGIILGGVTDVVIENCDISGWGTTMENGQAVDLNAAIYAKAAALERITIQHNDLHHPRSDSNSWKQERPGTNSSHPAGPQAIVFYGGQGGHVIRFNRIYSDMQHMFNDGMGETHNFSYAGFLVKDSDVHDNVVSHCWDDGIEVEGADMNIRVYHNYITMTYGAIGAAAPSLGPLYIFRNVYAVSRKHEGTEANDYRGHYLVKLGNENPGWTHGRIYIFHNTTLQPPAFPGFSDKTSGAQSGIVFTSNKKTQQNIMSRNNLLDMRKDSDWAILDTQKTINNDFDYDMYDGRVLFREGSQAHGIIAGPSYRRTLEGQLELRPGTPGHDAGVRLPNFNDEFAGEAPDVGAVETGGNRSKPPLWPDFPKAESETE